MSDTDAELRALQSRAYGREADIGADPAAQQRLADLESRRQPAPATEAVPTAAVDAPLIHHVPLARDGSAETPPPVDPPVERLDQPGVTPPRTLRDRFSPRPRVAWFVAAAAALLLTVGVTTAATSIARPVEPGVVATVPVDPDAEWSDILGERAQGSVIFEDYYGLTFVRSTAFIGPAGPEDGCLLAVSTKGLRSATIDTGFGGFSMGCPAGGFPATVQFVIDDGYPDALRERFPTGTAMKLTMRGNIVEVRVDR
ncbi:MULTISPECIES: hypothetical protein [unclassified Microbacterium]|uniref:hypothetical protein n=1 Tax=unclassified Microbacterium TaxID=2609290 RepID=UPI00342FF5A6